MHVMIIGAAGMAGRKLADRLAGDGRLGGRDVERLTLVDVVAPSAPASFSGAVETVMVDLSATGEARRQACRRGVPSRRHRVGRMRKAICITALYYPAVPKPL